VAFLGWSTHGAIRLVDHQRKIFAIVNARQEVSDQMDYAAFNVQIVAAKLHLLATLYQQYSRGRGTRAIPARALRSAAASARAREIGRPVAAFGWFRCGTERRGSSRERGR